MERAVRHAAHAPLKISDADLVPRFVQRKLWTLWLRMATFLFLYWSINYLALSAKFSRVVDISTAVVLTFYVLRFISSTIKISVNMETAWLGFPYSLGKDC